jgi:chromate reductase
VTSDSAQHPYTVVAFSGSIRSGSSNTGLLHLAARVAPPELRVMIDTTVVDLPWYDPDLEGSLPDVAADWRRTVEDADALVIGLPEYNFGPSALAKNAIDWLTRPLGQHALRGKVIALVTSGGGGGGSRVQGTIAPVLSLLGNTVVEEPVVQIARGAERLSADGTTDDSEIVDVVTAKMAALLVALRAR